MSETLDENLLLEAHKAGWAAYIADQQNPGIGLVPDPQDNISAAMTAAITAYLNTLAPRGSGAVGVKDEIGESHFYRLSDGSRARYPHGMTEAEWNAKIGDPSYDHAKDLPND